jgi:hypothetical protein
VPWCTWEIKQWVIAIHYVRSNRTLSATYIKEFIMDSFTINENDWSFKYLYKFSKEFRNDVRFAREANNHGFLPDNLCEYWQKVTKFATLHLSIIIAVLLELKFVWFFIENFAWFNDNKNFYKQIWYNRVEFVVGSIGAMLLSLLLIVVFLYYLITFLSWASAKTGFTVYMGDEFTKHIKRRDQKKAKKVKKPDGLFKTWYKTHKEQYCIKANYEITPNQYNEE